MVLDFELTSADMAMLDGLATLSESTDKELRPGWSSDVFGLHTGVGPSAVALGSFGQAAPASIPPSHNSAAVGHAAPDASQFREVARDQQCNRDLPDVKGEPFTLGGGGHTLAQCQTSCAAQSDCRFITFYHGTGFCHMYRN